MKETWYDPDYDEICTLEKLPKDRLPHTENKLRIRKRWEKGKGKVLGNVFFSSPIGGRPSLLVWLVSCWKEKE